MARSASQIRDSLVSTVQSTDPSTDLSKGPIFDFLIAPVAPELAVTEAEVEQLRQLTSLQLPDVARTDELNAIGTAFGVAPLQGTFSNCRQLFYCFSRPVSDIVIPRGVLVGTADGSYIFTVDEQVTLPVSQANLYFSSSRRRYEISAKIIAVASSPNYDLPSYRINRMFSTINGIDGTENREASTGGVTQQANSDYFKRIQSKFAGLNLNTGGGIISSVRELFPTTVHDVAIVYPKDREIFFRDTSRPALDVYILGTQPTTTTQYITASAVGGETSISLINVPALSVSTVVRNDVATTDYAFTPDATPQYRRSALANDKIVFSSPLNPSEVVTVTYTYDQVVKDSQSLLFTTNTRLFDTDILARMPLEVDVTVDINVNVVSSFDPSRVYDAVYTEIFNYCEPSVYVDDLFPEVLRSNIVNNVAGVSSISFNKFTKTVGSLATVETIGFAKNEIPVVDQTTLTIRTRQ